MNSTKLNVALIILLISACASPQRELTERTPKKDTPKAGYTELSVHFGVEVDGGSDTARRITFFHVDVEKTRTVIGTNFFPNFASRQNAYAISDDGRTLLFIHNEQALKNELKKESGLYEYRYGVGEKLLDPDARGGIYIKEYLPENNIVFKRKNCPKEFCFGSPTIVRSTEGNEYIWIELPDK